MSDIREWVPCRNLEVADLFDHPAVQRCLSVERQLTGPVALQPPIRQTEVVAEDRQSSRVVDLHGICHASRTLGICRRARIHVGLVDHESCVCAGIAIMRPEKNDHADG